MYPGLRRSTWRRRHLVFDPAFGVIQKPGLVGVYRPHWRAPNVEGLLFASETFRSRGIGVDRAARAALERVGHPFEEVDIEGDDDLLARYLERIPVVALDGAELYDFFVDEADLRRRLDARVR